MWENYSGKIFFGIFWVWGKSSAKGVLEVWVFFCHCHQRLFQLPQMSLMESSDNASLFISHINATLACCWEQVMVSNTSRKLVTLLNICTFSNHPEEQISGRILFDNVQHWKLNNVEQTVITLATLLLPPCKYRPPNKITRTTGCPSSCFNRLQAGSPSWPLTPDINPAFNLHTTAARRTLSLFRAIHCKLYRWLWRCEKADQQQQQQKKSLQLVWNQQPCSPRSKSLRAALFPVLLPPLNSSELI